VAPGGFPFLPVPLHRDGEWDGIKDNLAQRGDPPHKKLGGFRTVLRAMIVTVFNIAENGRNKLRPYRASAQSTSNDTNRDQ